MVKMQHAEPGLGILEAMLDVWKLDVALYSNPLCDQDDLTIFDLIIESTYMQWAYV